MSLQDINPNRGLICKPLPNGGPLIIMAKDTPGVYFDVNGELATDAMAAAAEFDVSGDRIKKSKTEALVKARAKIDKDFEAEALKLDSMTDSEMEEEGLVEPGSLTPDPATAAEPKGGADAMPFVTRTTGGEPRVARTVVGGPVKIMEFVPADKGWKVSIRDGKTLKSKLSKEDAEELLLKVEGTKAASK